MGHDSENKTTVKRCKGPGCFSRVVTYSTTPKQIAALMAISSGCRQFIRVLSNRLPILCKHFATFNIIWLICPVRLPVSSFRRNQSYPVRAWWNDQKGDPQYFWAGAQYAASFPHTCFCGEEKACSFPGVRCNCDAAKSPKPQFDEGNNELLLIENGSA